MLNRMWLDIVFIFEIKGVHDKFPFLPPSGTSKKFFFFAPLGVGVNQEKELFRFREFCRTPDKRFLIRCLKLFVNCRHQ